MPESNEPPTDLFELLQPLAEARVESNPWAVEADGFARYTSDAELLEAMLAVPIHEGSGSQTGRLAKAIDAWIVHELCRAGFADDEVWPRLTAPRVLPRDVANFIEDLPIALRKEAHARLLRNRRVAPADARVLGRAYVKQVDVLIAHWSRGPELLVSTKSMVSSFKKNLPNRFEEAYGDAKNLRGRYPLAAMGFAFLLRSTAAAVPGTVERAIDMLRKLKAENDVYDTTCLLIGEWEGSVGGVKILNDLVPDDLSANSFLATLVEAVLDRTPVEMHVQVRQRHSHRQLPLDEADSGAPADDREQSPLLPDEPA